MTPPGPRVAILGSPRWWRSAQLDARGRYEELVVAPGPGDLRRHPVGALVPPGRRGRARRRPRARRPAYLVALLGSGARRLVGVDPAEAAVEGLETVAADVRALPFPDRSFDAVLCLSTLHHVGRDNRAYGGPVEQDRDGPLRALRELRRVLRPSAARHRSLRRGAGPRALRPASAGGLGAALRRRRPLPARARDLRARGRRPGRRTAFSPDRIRYGERGAGASALLPPRRADEQPV